MNNYGIKPGADLEGNFGELKFSDEHGECLDQAEPDVVKEFWVLLFLLLGHLGVVGVEEDEEAEAEGNDEEGIPEEEDKIRQDKIR